MQIAAILLAAGAGRRIGGPKALLRIGDETFVSRCARVLSRAGVARLLVVFGHDAERVAASASVPKDATVILNRGYGEGGMLSSILRGLEAAEAAGADAALVHPVDHPLVEEATVERVIAALAGGAAIAVPSWDGRRGHPAGFAKAAWPWVRAAPAEFGARAALHQHPESIVHVAGDPGCLAGIDAPEDYARLVGGTLETR